MARFIAHRGLSARFPENTPLAFNQAWAHDCDGIELDIQVSADQQVMVIHDPNTLRTAGVDCAVAVATRAEIGQIDVGQGEGVATLDEVLAVMPSGKWVQIEIKHHIQDMAPVLEVLARLRDDINVQIISFDPDKLAVVRKHLPHLACFLVMDEHTPAVRDRIALAKTLGLVGLDMNHALATPEYVREVNAAGLEVACWTVNDRLLARELIARGVSFIASDIADELRD